MGSQWKNEAAMCLNAACFLSAVYIYQTIQDSLVLLYFVHLFFEMTLQLLYLLLLYFNRKLSFPFLR